MFFSHVGSVADGGEGKKRELGRGTFHDHEASFAFCRGIQTLTPHSSTFCHLSCGRSEPGSERRKRSCARPSRPPTYHTKDELRLNCVVEPYRLFRCQFSSFWVWTTHQHSNRSFTRDASPQRTHQLLSRTRKYDARSLKQILEPKR